MFSSSERILYLTRHVSVVLQCNRATSGYYPCKNKSVFNGVFAGFNEKSCVKCRLNRISMDIDRLIPLESHQVLKRVDNLTRFAR
jgi:hypothetical protein